MNEQNTDIAAADIVAALVGQTIRLAEVANESSEFPGDYIVLETWDGVRLYADSPTAYRVAATPTPREVALENPPEDLADAWKRYQEGGDVSGYELSQLDEWRADVNEQY